METHDAEVTTATTKIKTDRNTVKIEADPLHYGFWRLSLERGQLPLKFRGVYTKRILAEEAAKLYAASRTKD